MGSRVSEPIPPGREVPETSNGRPETVRFPPPSFADIAHALGIDFTFFRGESGQFWVPEVNGGGAAWIDFDGDGRLDLYLVNGCQLPENPKDFSHTSQLYRNGEGGFHNVTQAANVGHNGYGQGCGVGDYDNDGFDDLYVTCYGSNVLYRNRGDGTFSNVTVEAAADSRLWSSSCGFGDLNLDGALDLCVCNYTDFDPKTAPQCLDGKGEQPSYCGPRKFGPLPQVVLLNMTDGTFYDIAAEMNVPPGKALGIVISDFDSDRRPDIYIANDAEPNTLLHNLAGDAPRDALARGPSLRLEDKAVEWGAALNAEGLSQASMGIACGDYDGDGLLDLGVTNFYLEYLTLYRNLGQAGFGDASRVTGITAVTRASMGWGTAFLDYDNDGWLDLFATNGYLAKGPGSVPDLMPPTLLRNTGLGRFTNVAHLAGSYFAEKWIGRGAAFGDFDNDGRTDIAVVHHYVPTAVLHNETRDSQHVLMLEFAGRESNRNGVNVRVEAMLNNDGVEERRLVREVTGGGSYQSASDRRILLGLGTDKSVDKLIVHWPSGRIDEWDDVAGEGWLRLVEGLQPRMVQSIPSPARLVSAGQDTRAATFPDRSGPLHRLD